MLSLAIPDFATWEGKIFVGVLGFSWATYMWEEYLAYRQVSVLINYCLFVILMLREDRVKDDEICMTDFRD